MEQNRGQAYSLLSPMPPETVSVVPCSASQSSVGRWDFAIPPGEGAFTRPNVVAYATLVMPIQKVALASEGYRGDLTPEACGALVAKTSTNLGLKPEVILPKR